METTQPPFGLNQFKPNYSVEEAASILGISSKDFLALAAQEDLNLEYTGQGLFRHPVLPREIERSLQHGDGYIIGKRRYADVEPPLIDIRCLQLTNSMLEALLQRVPKTEKSMALKSLERFSLSEDETTAELDGEYFNLTSGQARVIIFLYSLAKLGSRHYSKLYVLEGAGLDKSAFENIFPSTSPNRTLIDFSSERPTKVRLNIFSEKPDRKL